MAPGPPPPRGLPGAPAPPSGLPGAPTASTDVARSSKLVGAPPPPMSLPGAGSLPAPQGLPAAPQGLPGAPSGRASSSMSSAAPLAPSRSSLPGAPPASGVLLGPGPDRRGSTTGGGAPPPPPMSLPSAPPRTGPSECGMGAAPPPPPTGLPGPPGSGYQSQSAAPLPVAGLAASGYVQQRVAGAPAGFATSAMEKAEDAQEDDDGVVDDSWRQYLEGVSSEESSGSGEDSDEAPDAEACEDRRKHDLEMLQRSRAPLLSRKVEVPAAQNLLAEEAKAHGTETTEAVAGRADIGERPRDDGVNDASSSTPSKHNLGNSPAGSPSSTQGVTPGSKRGSLMSRFFKGDKADSGTSTGGKSLLDIEMTHYDEAWFQRQTTRFCKDGFLCTKVATNGKPYERRVIIDPRNLMFEVCQGRQGTTGVSLDDLVDVRAGLCTDELQKFCIRFKKDIVASELDKRAFVLKTPARTFSFLFSSESQRDTVGRLIVYLLKQKQRGMMAPESQANSRSTSGEASRKPPKEGFAKVLYENRSTYDGEFHNSMRHGEGTLVLSDGTNYKCQWRHDERHGEGKEIWADGTVFAGNYVKGMRHGSGVMTWPEGSKYSGMFERGRANGQGELVRTDGSVYRGEFAEDCMAGEGVMRWKDGVEYTGQFAGNRREGVGRMMWTSGRWKCYEGHWKEGVQHGQGLLTDQSGGKFNGTFNNGKLEKWDDDSQPSAVS